MCPFTSLPAGEGPNRFSPATIKDWQPRRKSVSNACERCRRRKIKCDGETPCATCKRFALQCVRTQKPRDVVALEHREALEGRIHQLEAQLAAHVNAPMHGMESPDGNLMASTPTSFDWQTPPPGLNLHTSIPASFTANLDIGSFSAGGSMSSMSINECEHVPNVASPSSDISLWSGTTRASGASSPDMPPTSAPTQFVSISQHLSSGKCFVSAMEPHTAPSWEFMARASSDLLKPEARSSRGHSRRTSASSLSVDSDEQAMSPILEVDDDLLPLAPAPRLPRQGLFAATHAESPTPGSSRSSFTDRSRALATTPLPSRFEAETLTTEFVHYIESLQYGAYNIPPPLFSRFCENVYPNPQHLSSAVELSISIPMARFHVFLAMAIAMKLRIRNSPENTNALMDTCYELAIQQAPSPTFWQEQGGFEAAQLLSVFASIRKMPNNEPTPLQQSFTW